MEEIHRKKGKVYRDCVYIYGKKENSPVFKRKADCIAWKHQRKAKLDQARALGIELVRLAPIRFNDFFIDWLEAKRAQGLANKSIEIYESKARTHLLPVFGTLMMTEVTLKRAETLLSNLRKSHAPKGASDVIVLLKQIMRDAYRRKVIAANPLEYLRNGQRAKRTPAYWTRDDVNRFLNHCRSHELNEVILMALNTGMRRGEIAGLCWDRVDWAGGQVIVSRTRDRHTLKEETKTKCIRYIPMNDLIRAILTRCRANSKDARYVFNVRGKPFSVHHLYREFEELQNKAGITNKIRFHDLRHTFASHYVMNGGSLYDLQHVLGHASASMTERYAHLSPEHLRQAMKVVTLGTLDSSELSQIHPTGSGIECLEVSQCLVSI